MACACHLAGQLRAVQSAMPAGVLALAQDALSRVGDSNSGPSLLRHLAFEEAYIWPYLPRSEATTLLDLATDHKAFREGLKAGLMPSPAQAEKHGSEEDRMAARVRGQKQSR